jgi:hypothetical protein
MAKGDGIHDRTAGCVWSLCIACPTFANARFLPLGSGFLRNAEPVIHLRSRASPPSPKIEFGFACQSRNIIMGASESRLSSPSPIIARPGRPRCSTSHPCMFSNLFSNFLTPPDSHRFAPVGVGWIGSSSLHDPLPTDMRLISVQPPKLPGSGFLSASHVRRSAPTPGTNVVLISLLPPTSFVDACSVAWK